MRPVLLVVSMIAVMLLADVVLRYLNTYMMPAFEMASSAEGGWEQDDVLYLAKYHLLCVYDDHHARGVFIDPPHPG